MKLLVTVILPTLNEKENIIPLIREINKEVPKAEIIVVDDDSSDGTSEAVLGYQKKNKQKNIQLIKRLTDHGLTSSLRDGIKISHGNILVWMDCDFSMPPRVIPKLLQKIEEGNDIAMGSRFLTGGQIKTGGARDSLFLIYLSKILNKCMRVLLGTTVTDYTSGFIAVKKSVCMAISLSGDYGEYFIDFIVRAHWKGYKISEVPYISPPRMYGDSKTGRSIIEYFWRGRKYVMTIARLMYENFTRKFS